jgi:hypothetical protein
MAGARRVASGRGCDALRRATVRGRGRRRAGARLLEAAPDWLARLPYELTHREIEFSTVAEARQLRRPAFVKPPNDKSFPARVYPDGSRLPGPDAVDVVYSSPLPRRPVGQ